MKKEKFKIITAACAGAVIGGITGVLFAPRKGSETRAKIKDYFLDLKNKLQGVTEENVKEYIEKELDSLDLDLAKLDMETEYKKAKKLAKKIIKKINKLINYTKKKGMGDFEELINDLKEKAEEIGEEILTNLED